MLPVGEAACTSRAARATGPFDAYFRAGAARLLPAEAALPPGTLGAARPHRRSSYPGDVWRYAVDAAGQRFLIDDATKFGEAAAVRVAVPASALHLFPA